MKTEQTAQQFELAAQILRTGHPWEWQASDGEWVKPTLRTELHHVISDGLAIRPVLATPPDGRPIHNPDNLTAEQVGVGYRLVCYDDKTTEDKLEKWIENEWAVVHCPIGQISFRDCSGTYRLPLSVPWPETQPDPYAALKKAHAEGKVIQIKRGDGSYLDISPSETIAWGAPVAEYRIKPTFQLPPPPPGMQWHREDGWQDGDLPQGWRPLVAGELITEEDECCHIALGAQWGTCYGYHGKPASEANEHPYRDEDFSVYHARTRRPLTFTHEGKTWTWHRPGDPMPCDGEWFINYLMVVDWPSAGRIQVKASVLNWGEQQDPRHAIIGWRYFDEKKTVPLGPEDVKPFTVIRRKGEAQTWHWRTISYVDAVKVTCGNRGYGWDELASDYERNESLSLTGKWNPDAWEACSKQIDA